MENNNQLPPEELVNALDVEHDAEESLATSNDWLPEWYMKKLGQIQMAKSAIDTRYSEIVRQLDNEVSALDYRFSFNVELVGKGMLAKLTSKKKSIKLLTGTIGHRTVKDKIQVVDHQKAFEWGIKQQWHWPDIIATIDTGKALELIKIFCDDKDIEKTVNALMVSMVRTVKATPFTQWFLDTGEIPDGCEVVEGGEKFYAKPVQLKLEGEKDE